MIYPKIQTQRSKSNVNIFSKHLLSPDKQETKRKCLVEKFAIALKLKHDKLFKEKGYTHNLLAQDLNSMISVYELDNFNYNSYMFKLDKEILDRVLPMPLNENILSERNISDLPDMKGLKKPEKIQEIKKRRDSTKADTKNGLNTSQKKPLLSLAQDLQPSITELNLNQILSQRNPKVIEYKLKEQDIWGKYAKEEYKKFQEEKEEKKKIIKEKNLELQHTLEMQVKLKKNRGNYIDEDQYYLDIQKRLDEKFDQKEQNKKNILKDKYKEIDENRHYLINEKKKQEDVRRMNEIQKDLTLIENFKRDLEEEKSKKNKKKDVEREHYKQTFENNGLRAMYLNSEKEKEKIENERIDKQFIEMADKKDKDRENYFNSIKEKFKRNGEVTSQSILQDKLMREAEDKKIIQEIEEQDKR